MSTAPWASAALKLRDAEWDLSHAEYLLAADSRLYDAAAHGRARDALLKELAELIAAALEARARLLPPAAAEGDAPPLAERPAPKIVSANVHGRGRTTHEGEADRAVRLQGGLAGLPGVALRRRTPLQEGAAASLLHDLL